MRKYYKSSESPVYHRFENLNSLDATSVTRVLNTVNPIMIPKSLQRVSNEIPSPL